MKRKQRTKFIDREEEDWFSKQQNKLCTPTGRMEN